MITASFSRFVSCIVIVAGVVCEANYVHSEDFSENVDPLVSLYEKILTPITKESWFWKEYEFGSGVVNREELQIIDIQIWQDLSLQQNITNWQYIKHNDESFIVGTAHSTLFVYHLDHENNLVTPRGNLSIDEIIKSFEIISFSSNDVESTEIKDSIIVILSIENSNSTQYLKWFYLRNYKFYSFWIWELLKNVKSLKYFNIEDNHNLIVLYEKDVYFNQNYSLIEVYDIKTSGQFSKQLSCQFLITEISDIRICPSQEGSKTFAMVDNNYVTLHEYRHILSKCVLKSVKNITVSNVSNVICFESSSTNHLTVLGSVTQFFKFHSNEFVYEEEMETLLNEIRDTHFVTYLSIDTYRNDIILLIQLKNLTVFALCWQNENFQFVRLPNNKLNAFDLSKVTVIPNYGLLNGNKFVKLKAELVQLPKPEKSDIEILLKTKSILEDILIAQESRISKINLEIQPNYLNNLKIENFNDLPQIDVKNLSVNKINNLIISMESGNFSLEQLQINYEESRSLLYELEANVGLIENQLERMVPISSNDIPFLEEIDVIGNFEITGTAKIDSLFTDYLNNVDVDVLMNNYLIYGKKIMGNKKFPSIKFSEGNLKIRYLHGVPIENFQFQIDNVYYRDIDFSKIKILEIKGNLNLFKFNGIDWNNLMNQLVFTNKEKVIPGCTTFSGVMNSSFIRINYLNDLKYPIDYVLKSGPENGEVTGVKTIETLTVSDLRDVKKINDIDADEFIILNADQNLEHRIIFENVVIEKSIQIDGRITELSEQYVNSDLTLLNSNIIHSHVMFNNLLVSGNVYVKSLIDGIEWSEIDDLILKNDESVIVTGRKIFPNNVQILDNLVIKSNVINDHPINSFITLDSHQIMPNLSKITGNVTFIDVMYEELENIEDELRINLDDVGLPKCSTKPFVFLKAPIVDEFSSLFVNGNISGSDFSDKLEVILNDTNFVNLKCRKLIVEELKPIVVNDINIRELESKKITRNTYQGLSGRMKISNLETKNVHIGLINNRSYELLGNVVKKINFFYKEFVDNKRSIYSLKIDKFITTPKINGKILYDFFNLNEKTEFLLQPHGLIENLTVKGLVNNINFTEKFTDCVMKNEEVIIIKGPKKFNKFTSRNLTVEYINSHSIQDIMTDTRNQTLIGHFIIKGSAYVTKNFNSNGKINDLNYQSIQTNIGKVNDTIYTLVGNFSIDNCKSINNLVVTGRIQKKEIIKFIDNLIYLNDTEVIVSSSKIFDGLVKFNDYITASKRLNNLELELFYKNAVSIDNYSSVNSPIIFENDVLVEEDLTVLHSLKVRTIKDINIDNMMENAVYFNRPTFLTESVTFSNVVFKSDITVTIWNNTALDMLLILNKDEVIKNTLTCVNVDVENLTINGSVNSENLTNVYRNTFMISSDQQIYGKMSFLNNIFINGNLASRYMNDIDITKIISLETSDSMEGNFIFDRPVVINDDLIVLQYLNNINISQWQSSAIIMSSQVKYNLSGNWTIHHNGDFKENIRGSGFINNVNIDHLSNAVRKENEDIKQFISDETKNINTLCKNLQERTNQINHFLYKFKSFEYLRVLQFDKKIESAHHFEFNGTDFILVNFETCQIDIYAYTTEGFLLFANTSNFGNIKQYLNFNYNDYLYLVTTGKVQCGRNSGNLWMLYNKQVKHIYDLGNVTSIEKLNDVTFVVIVDHQVQEWSIENIHQNIFEPMNIRSIMNNNMKFLTHGTDTLLVSCDVIYQFQNGTSELDKIKNPFKSTDISSFRAGFHRKEHILLHDDEISSDRIFIYDQDLYQPKELQAIQAHKPNSFIIINFDGLYESLLVFSENKREIKVYKYKGIEHFEFHSSIQMKVDKLYSFQIRTHPYFVKRHCIAVVHDFKLTILEAKMYGEKLNPNNQIICDDV